MMTDDRSPRKVDNEALGKTAKKKTEKGPHGGGVNFNQTTIGKGFIAVDPRDGHKQKKNLK